MIDEILRRAEERMKARCREPRNATCQFRTGAPTRPCWTGSPSLIMGRPHPSTSLPPFQRPSPGFFDPALGQDAMQAIEKAILQSDLGLTPNSDGSMIRMSSRN